MIRILATAAALLAVAVLLAVRPAGEARSAAGCFGYRGVELSSNNAWECIAQDSDEGGALYWQTNNNDHEWDLHPDSGNLAVNAITFPVGQQNPYYGFTAVIDSAAGGCVVAGAGYGTSPTMCADPGQPPRPMTAQELASYADFAEIMGEKIPDCAWQPAGTPPPQTC